MNDSDDMVLEPEDTENGTPEATLKKIRDELKKAKAEAADYLSGWQRSKADYINLSRRAKEEAETVARLGTVRVVERLVPVFDSLEAALKDASGDTSPLTEGVRQVLRQFETALATLGVTRLAPGAGDAFDPTRHESVGIVATSSDSEDNTISELLQSGFELSGLVIRPARVRVFHYQPASA